MSKVIFENKYSSEELCDVERDLYECFDGDFNPKVRDIPSDENGFHEGGYFKITVEWIED